jgi:hypothetical protein
MLLAAFSGGRSFALRVILGLIFVALAAWADALSLISRCAEITLSRSLR